MEIEKIKESTLDNPPKLYHIRRCGNTSRLIDHAIQLLFEGKIVKIKDHHEYGEHTLANRNLFKRVLYRLKNEHHLDKNTVLADVDKLTIELM